MMTAGETGLVGRAMKQEQGEQGSISRRKLLCQHQGVPSGAGFPQTAMAVPALEMTVSISWGPLHSQKTWQAGGSTGQKVGYLGGNLKAGARLNLSGPCAGSHMPQLVLCPVADPSCS